MLGNYAISAASQSNFNAIGNFDLQNEKKLSYFKHSLANATNLGITIALGIKYHKWRGYRISNTIPSNYHVTSKDVRMLTYYLKKLTLSLSVRTTAHTLKRDILRTKLHILNKGLSVLSSKEIYLTFEKNKHKTHYINDR